MGNYLPSPNSEKVRESLTIGNMQYACCEMQGWRCAMEDAHLFRYFEHLECTDGPALFCGVYDGHGGQHVATFVARHLIDELFRASDFRKGRLEAALRSTYISLDRLLGSSQNELLWHSRKAANTSSTPARSPGEITPAVASEEPSAGGATPSDDALTSSNSIEAPRPVLWENATVITREEALQVLAELEAAEHPDRRSRRHNGPARRRKKSVKAQHHQQQQHHQSHTAPSQVSPIVAPPLLQVLPSDDPDSTGNQPDSGSRLTRWRRSAANRAGGRRGTPAFPSEDPGNTPRCNSGNSATASLGNGNPPTASSHSQQNQEDQQSGGFRNFIAGLFRRSGSQALPSDPLPLNHLAMHAGCTAVTVLVTNRKIVVANAGDSRCVLCRGDTALELSKDHKPQNAAEKARIYAAGGWVEMGRVNGNLNLSRAIGDLNFKSGRALPPEKQVVSCVPDVTTTDLLPADEFLIVGCDGIWEASSSQEIVDFVKQRIDSGSTLSAILDELLDELLSPNPTLFEFGCDNMTAIIVDLQADRRANHRKRGKATTSTTAGGEVSASPQEPQQQPRQHQQPLSRRAVMRGAGGFRGGRRGGGGFRAACLAAVPRAKSGEDYQGRLPLLYREDGRRPMSEDNLTQAAVQYDEPEKRWTSCTLPDVAGCSPASTAAPPTPEALKLRHRPEPGTATSNFLHATILR